MKKALDGKLSLLNNFLKLIINGWSLERKPIPNDLKSVALDLQHTLEWDDLASEQVTSHEDDEYRWAGVEDPKVVITTSRDPSARLKMFAKVSLKK